MTHARNGKHILVAAALALAALKAIQEATGHLQNSLRIAGVVVPRFPDK